MKAKWDLVIADYDKVIELDSSYASPPDHQANSGEDEEEWDLAIADYNKAIELSKDPALVQKANESITFIDELRKDIVR